MKAKLANWSIMAAFVASAAGAVLMPMAAAQVRARVVPNQPNAGGQVNLPWMANDNKGNVWRVYQNGYMQNQGPTPNGGNTQTFSQSAILMINGNNPQQNVNQARMDAKTGELVIEGLQGQGYSITRRIAMDKDDGFLRYIDIIKNTQNQEQTFQVVLTSNLNYGVTTSQIATGKKDETIGWACQTGSMASLFEMYAGKGSKLTPTIVAQAGNSQCQATFQVTAPAGKEVALMHLHGMTGSQDAGLTFMKNLKESNLVKKIPSDIRKLLVNFGGGQSFIGELEILRGDLLDVVELKSGDQLKGTLKEQTYQLDTFFGAVTLPVDRVIGIMNIGQFRPRQLMVTVDGQVFGGRLKKETLDLQLSSGQVTQVPLSQVNRVGYRKRAGEPEEWTFDKPMVLMRSGERISVKMPTEPIEVATRYGKLTLKPESIGAVLLQNDENMVHQVLLADGSKFAGLLTADKFDMTLEGVGADQDVSFPTSSMARFQLHPKVEEVDSASTPTVTLANDDVFVGTISGALKVDTTFDTIAVNAAEVRSITRAGQNPTDVQVVLFDGSTVSGQLQETELSVQLGGGMTLKAPVALLEEYSQPQPQPSAEMSDQIKKLIDDMNSDDWRVRDRAQEQLKGMGPVAISILKQVIGDTKTPEARDRIEKIIKALEDQQKDAGKKKASSAAPAGAGGVLIPEPGLAPQILIEKQQLQVINEAIIRD